jgi:hypothetical protein
MISRAGTEPRVFQYAGLKPQIKKADPAYITPHTVSEWDVLASEVMDRRLFSAFDGSMLESYFKP